MLSFVLSLWLLLFPSVGDCRAIEQVSLSSPTVELDEVIEVEVTLHNCTTKPEEILLVGIAELKECDESLVFAQGDIALEGSQAKVLNGVVPFKGAPCTGKAVIHVLAYKDGKGLDRVDVPFTVTPRKVIAND